MDKKGNNYKYKIEGRDLDFSKRPSIMAVTDYILQAAGEDADTLGFGVRELNRENNSWVLSRMAVEIERLPDAYQPFNIRTWVGDLNRMMTTRNFVLSDQNGTQIGAATTLWAMIDLTSRTPLDLRSYRDYSSAVIDQPAPIAPAAKVVCSDASPLCSHRVAYSDIDFNQHANSIKYIEWLVDMLPIEWHSGREISRLDINYIHEARYGDTLQISGQIGQPSTFEIKNSDGAVLSRAAIHFKL